MIRNLFGRKKAPVQAPPHLISEATSTLLLGSDMILRAQLFTDMLIPQAIEAGQSFFMVRDSESQWLADHIKSRVPDPSRVRRLRFLEDSVLSDDDYDIYRDFVRSSMPKARGRHLVISYPDNYQDSEKSDLWRTVLIATAHEYMDQMTDFVHATTTDVTCVPKGPRKPVFFGDMDRLDDTVSAAIGVKLAQFRALGFRSVVHMESLTPSNISPIGSLLVNTACAVFGDSQEFINLQHYKVVREIFHMHNVIDDTLLIEELRNIRHIPALQLLSLRPDDVLTDARIA